MERKQLTELTTIEDDTIIIISDNIQIVIKHNNVGISIDTYPLGDDSQPLTEGQYWFEDY